jgi:hypothetical protein
VLQQPLLDYVALLPTPSVARVRWASRYVLSDGQALTGQRLRRTLWLGLKITLVALLWSILDALELHSRFILSSGAPKSLLHVMGFSPFPSPRLTGWTGQWKV